MPKLAASDWFASTSSLASSIWPPRLETAASRAGPSWRQGPHHSAQKSTTTGTSRERSTTRVANSDSFTSKIIVSRLASGHNQP